MAYRLGLDVGANSIGWCAIRLGPDGQPAGLLDIGVRIHSDGRNPKDGSSLAAERRGPRGLRRNRDRYLQRRTALLNALTRSGLMPAEAQERKRVARLNPYRLRTDALHRMLQPYELGRVLFHLNQRRGFQSNRLTDRGNKDGGLISEAAKETEAMLLRTGNMTIGALLAERHAAHEPVRVRLAGSGKAAKYDFYPQRAMVKAEFDAVWAAQSAWNPALSNGLKAALWHIIFSQRPLRAPVVGKCWLEPGQDRAARALPSAQRFRIAQTVAHLRVSQPGMPERALSDTERGVLLALLFRGTDQPVDRLWKKLGLPAETDVNCRDDKLPGCAVAARLGGKSGIGPGWHALPLAVQDSAVQALCAAETEDAAVAALQTLGLSAEQALRAVNVTLPDGHASLSLTALRKVLPFLEAGQTYDKAVQAAGYRHHSDRRTGEIRDRLPYYGEILCQRIGTGSGEPDDAEEKRLGKAPNPTVHVALNEIRRVVNAVIETHGVPAEIVIETLRELGQSAVQRKDYEAEQKKNRVANDRRRAEIVALGFKVSSDSLLRMRLLEEQAKDPKQRCCVYTGTLISPRLALSDAVEVDHILPRAVTLDDSAANKILVTRVANRQKARQSPHAAFSHTAEWAAILERRALLPDNKKWRFAPDALEKFAREGDFLARHLTDSATIARWAAEYLEILAPGRVRAVPGRLTGLLRHALGLNSRSVLGKGGAAKDRTDHRHHAIDAVVVALTDRGMLQRVTRAMQAAEAAGERLMLTVEAPWDGFVADMAARLGNVIVAHKPDTGWQGALHNDTSYGIIKDAGPTGHNVVVRRSLETFVTWKNDDTTKKVRDPVLAEKIGAILAAPDASARKKQLSEVRYGGGPLVRSARVTERLEVRAIADRRTGEAYRAVKLDGNHCYEVWRCPDGTLQQFTVSRFDAARSAEAERLGRKAATRARHPAAKLLMRLHKNDMVALGCGETRRIMRVAIMTGAEIRLAPHNEGGVLRDRDRNPSDPFKYLRVGVTRLSAERARKVWVRPDGRILDPGPVL